jgi:hypothetical protein
MEGRAGYRATRSHRDNGRKHRPAFATSGSVRLPLRVLAAAASVASVSNPEITASHHRLREVCPMSISIAADGSPGRLDEGLKRPHHLVANLKRI